MVGRSVCCERENWNFQLERSVSNDGVEEGGLDWNNCLSEGKSQEGRDSIGLQLSCLFSKLDSSVQSSVGYRVTTCKLGQ